MNKFLLAVSATTLTFSLSAQSAQPSPSLETALGFFVGSCWSGTFSDGESTDVQCFRSVYDGKFVRSNHQVEGTRGPYGGETIFRWDKDAEQLTYTYWDTSGGMSSGTMMPAEDGLRAPDETYQSADGTEMTIKSAWKITGPDSWQQSVEQITGDSRETLWTINYKRAPLNEGPRPH